MGILSSLNYEQREATAILQIGTFLEYFDLMLYVHMAVLLNELFFPKTDPHVASLISAATFCTPFIFRPFGALFFGYLGDTIGRKSTVIITTMMASLCCVTMAILPTYDKAGIIATISITICRIFQGLSSMGELVGAQIYLTELIKVPERYPIVTFIRCAHFLGTLAALLVATCVFAIGADWRVAFLIGALIAIVGTVARTALRETPDFINAKVRLKKHLEKVNIDSALVLKQDPIVNEKVNQVTSLAYLLTQCSGPVWFYFLYVHCSGILKHSFHYSAQQIIQHNLLVTAVEFLSMVFYGYLSYKIYPLKIIKVKLAIFSVFIIFVPYILLNISTVMHIFFIQVFVCLFHPTSSPATAITYIHFPIFKRFRYASFLYALARALMYVVTSFGLVYLTKIFGHWGLLVVFIPVLVGFKFGFFHFEKLEKASGNYPQNTLLNYQDQKVGV